MIDFFAESDIGRENYNGKKSNWTKTTKRIELLNGPIAEELKSLNPSLNISREKKNRYHYFYSKKHDILIGSDTVLETKFYESGLDKNINNNLESEIGRCTLIEDNGKRYFSLICIRSSSTKHDFQYWKKHCEAYSIYIKNLCILFYNDETKEYALLAGDDYDTFLHKAANKIDE